MTAFHRSPSESATEFVTSEHLLAAIVDSSDDAIISKDLNGIITSWNKAAERIFGYTAEEAVGRPVLMLIPKERENEETQILERLRKGERVDHFDTVRQRKDGSFVEVSLTISPVKSNSGTVVGASKIAREITERRRAENALTKYRGDLEIMLEQQRITQAALRDSEALSRSVLNNTADCVKVLDLDGTFFFMNPPGLAAFDLESFDAIKGTKWADLWPAEIREVVNQAVRDAAAGMTSRFTGACPTAKGVPKWWDVIVTPVYDGGGKVDRLTATSRDVTEQKKASEDLLKAKAEVERQGRIKDEFLATLSHELRTPLQSVVGWTEVLRSGPEDKAEWQQGLDVIARNAHAQTRIIEDLLDMSRILAGKVRLDVQRVRLDGVLETAIETVRPAAEAKNIKLNSVLDPLAQSIVGDPNRLQQIFWNLLSNAIKFTPRDGRVHVTLERVNSHLEVSISDTGAGISPEFLPYVFDRFRQADASTTRRHGGLGLGLAIVKHLTELHGGTVKVKSAGPGMGSTFVVGLPVALLQLETAEEQHRHPEAMPSDPPRIPTVNLTGVSILAVDDEDDARDLLKKILVRSGAEVRIAGSSKEAMEMIHQSAPDILISDIGMPREDGYALIRAVRALPAAEGGRIPALALSAYTRKEDRIRSLSEGFQMHLSKPAEPVELLAVVMSLAKRAKGGS